MSSENKTQRWQCKTCGASGSVMIEQGAGVMSGINQVADAHTITSPACAEYLKLQALAPED